jgi:hypothetical protein
LLYVVQQTLLSRFGSFRLLVLRLLRELGSLSGITLFRLLSRFGSFRLLNPFRGVNDIGLVRAHRNLRYTRWEYN